MPRSCRSTCHYADSWEVCSASASGHLWSLQRSRAAKALLILLGAVCAGGSAALVPGRTIHRSGRGDAISLAIYGPRALASSAGGWPGALAEVAAVFLLQLVLFQLAEEIGFTGFLQHHWQDR